MTISGKHAFASHRRPHRTYFKPHNSQRRISELKIDYLFLAFRVKPAEIANAVNGMRALNIRGLNVTMPHKTAVVKHLDRVDLSAQIVNSVNTILNKENLLFGFNTDGVGALKALKENGVEPKGRKVLLLGAGGAARAIAYALAKEADELAVLNRTVKAAQNLAKVLERTLNKKVAVGSFSSKDVA
jgi:shikimate dehydrogenase